MGARASESGLVLAFDVRAIRRLLHPAYRHAGDEVWEPVRWRDLPNHQTEVTATAAFREVAGWRPYEPLPGGVDAEPDHGNVNRRDLATLTGLLAYWTTTADDVWFCIWVGYGWTDQPQPDTSSPLVRLPRRDHWLCRGTIDDALRVVHEQAPTLWWPDDRAWCVSTDVDSYSTYVGATAACIDTILTNQLLEAVACTIDDVLVAD